MLNKFILKIFLMCLAIVRCCMCHTWHMVRCQSHRRTLLSLSVKLVMHLAFLVNIFVLRVCVGFFSSGFPLRRCVSGPPSLDLQSHDMEHNRYATFSATELRDYSRDYAEIPVDPDSPCTSSEQIGMFIGSTDDSES